MSAKSSGGGKLPGKTLYAGRRREMTRTSGFKVHSETTGGEFRRLQTPIAMLGAGKAFKVNFSISGHAKGDWIGYGVWFWHDDDAVATITEKSPVASTLTSYGGDSWNKAGSIWKAASDAPVELTLVITANKGARVAIYAPECGHIQHNYLDNARDALLKNMYQFSPEAIFITDKNTGRCKIEPPRELSAQTKPLILKSCNRCGRYLPINFPVERDQLSFNNHCVAAHRRPCRHATFGRLRNVENHQEVLQLDYGFQLECRFCKKFEVNAAHNPQRSSAQMKEDGARRRAFELLLAELYGGTPQLRYRHETGSELANDVWTRFNKSCFRCKAPLESPRQMHLDHTRPLALLWPLDRTATALCASCNSEKRDRMPSEFYTAMQLEELAKITGVTLKDLSKVHPNDDAIKFLLDKLDWFFNEFLLREEMTKERDGKIAGELVVKALQKVISRSPAHAREDLQAEYERRRKQ